MNVVDSSGWLEYFADGPNADYFSDPILDVDQLIVPSISIYEVYKVVLRQKSEAMAINAVSLMRQGTLVNLDFALSLTAAQISLELRLPMADSILLASARKFGAVLWTQDIDFQGIEGVRYFSKAV